MKITLILLFLSGLSLFALDIPEALIAEVKSPKSISRHPADQKTMKSFDIPLGKGAIIEGDDIVAFLLLEKDPTTEKTIYKFRTYSKRFKYEVKGQGTLFENYYTISEPHSSSHEGLQVDKGSQITIDAGLFALEWSQARFIYFNSAKWTVAAGGQEEYESRIK